MSGGVGGRRRATSASYPIPVGENLQWNMKSSGQRAFTLIELLAVVAVIIILASVIIPRVVVLRQQSTQERNNLNARQIANAIERFQLEGGTVTNVSSVEAVVNQLTDRQMLCPSQKLTSRQITMIATNGYLFFYGTYDD